MDVDGRIYSDAIKATLSQSLDASRYFFASSQARRVLGVASRTFERARSGVARRTFRAWIRTLTLSGTRKASYRFLVSFESLLKRSRTQSRRELRVRRPDGYIHT
jgi:hypothetical protein